MDSAPIALPAPSVPERRGPLPVLAAVVPVAAGVVLWLATGAVYALWFAAVGPVMMAASLLDGVRTRRRDRRRDAARAAEQWAEAEALLRSRHDGERAALRRRHPDAASCLQEAPLRPAEAPDGRTAIVVGRGERPSDTRCTGGDGDRGRAFRERCAVLEDAPIAVPLGGGVCVRGPAPVVAAVTRALIVQLCLRFGPASLSVVGRVLGELGLAAMPHAARERSGLRVAVTRAGEERVDADAVVWMTPAGAEVPAGVTTVIDVAEPDDAVLRTAEATVTVAVECLSLAQAEAIAADCADREDAVDTVPDAVSLTELDQPETRRGLAVAVGRGDRGAAVLDLVDDGPHAVVTGMTGSGKSELLVTWVTAMAAQYGPDRVSFVLVDFKGGTAFEPLRGLRQVAAVVTDLDESGAHRGVTSLTAELRRREAALAAGGARDISEVSMPRLVIVVDEFAALVQEHPDLATVFTDIAARGRALGMHLVLGTQRSVGVLRDALLANCPLRVSLRVADAADSRAVVGTDAAAELPGGPEGRGLALVRRATDSEPSVARVAVTSAADLRRAAMRWSHEASASSPWLPPLAHRIALSELRGDGDGSSEGEIVLGRADDPARQMQPPEVLSPGRERGIAVLGAPGSGRSSLVRTVAAQCSDVCVVPRDPEAAIDLLTAWNSAAEAVPTLVLCDDIDAIHADLPAEYAQEFAHGWERIVRSSPETTWVLTAGRATGGMGRVLDALPRRALLRLPSRLDHLAAGGEGSGFLRDRGAGRARIGDREVQFAWVEPGDVVLPQRSSEGAWSPTLHMTALVTPAAESVAAALRAAHPEWTVVGQRDLAVEPAGHVSAPRILVADAEAWHREWAIWQQIRAQGEVLVRAERPSDLRQLVGQRDAPPYARPHAGRAWSVVGDRPARRVVVPALTRA